MATHHVPTGTQFYSAGSSVSFNIPEFTPGEASIILQGDAKILDSGILALPDQPSSKSDTISRALYASPVTIWSAGDSSLLASFETSFTFSVSDVGTYKPADGLVFFLAPWETKSEIPANSGGGMLGIVNSGNAFNQFVAVEFDTYHNGWDPAKYDSHIGINVNSLISLKTVKWDRESHQSEKVNISYDSQSKTLSVVVTHPDKSTTSISQAVDLKDVLPEQVSVGFSATTTPEYRENHFVNSWSFSSKY